MTYYVWTISKPGRQDIKKVTTLPELQDAARPGPARHGGIHEGRRDE